MTITRQEVRANRDFETDAEELNARRRFMSDRGYRFCDIPACNCNSWHGGHADARLREISDALNESGCSTNGSTILRTIERLLHEAGYGGDDA